MKDIKANKFGKLPNEITEYLTKRFWDNTRTLKQLLKAEISFPIRIALKPPNATAALGDINHFQQFIKQWQEFRDNKLYEGCEVVFETRRFRDLGEQEIPLFLNIEHFNALLSILGHACQKTLLSWQVKFQTLHQLLAPKPHCAHQLFLAMVEQLEVIVGFDDDMLLMLSNLISQLKPNMGHGLYLRALPIIGVDTKFLELNMKLVESLAKVVIDPAIESQGLQIWLGVNEKPKDWLLVKPLCPNTQQALGNIPLMRLSTEVLRRFILPAKRILVVENEQSCLGLPELPDTIAVAGGGKNIAWLDAKWLEEKQIGYWGDIDSEGLTILSEARAKQSHIQSLMMNELVVTQFKKRMVNEPHSIYTEPKNLTYEELILFRELRTGKFGLTRLEQEKIPPDYIIYELKSKFLENNI
ncbi:Wadjet anti-phage system protein JetD domain-containing protein [Thorsellia anophelis]|uniref:Wadjet protein JetD C-terminal domain-containing protein n=1 Tax=Thorsellia anophelis DSM 18579 TaxID=1123402 RepID=A0A1I0EZ04_9GAMM|nr:Wadjet anti-phage system protein JetD domain-containing protein [Thorsellia anophelis]SET50912.1 hypothetical protein SAMN02583745_02579 [Thorsellia anophelis DSM 18579]